MNKKKTAIVLLAIMLLTLGLSACSLFGGDKEEGDEPELTKRYYYVPGEHFVVNIKDSKMLCKAGVALVMFEKDKTTELDQNKPAIRNICMQILRDQTEEAARSDDAIANLEEQMTEQLTEFLNMPEFHAVYISDFVVQ